MSMNSQMKEGGILALAVYLKAKKQGFFEVKCT
jgi:hypothetical protein